ncbi:hypothetical protein N7466_010132 [Penicillium verhagenii]|uniref:uncharacterized protein n=1 Tax=Penicillium verhagenii TaxID=1562060 RepID=UPI002544F1D2|nr:uncharacterized protein N7466_010132 [Penicillium verhagenii]KAJ5919189.1 hypothetical protein N7466_010132 [Penicillium verhagenii]
MAPFWQMQSYHPKAADAVNAWRIPRAWFLAQGIRLPYDLLMSRAVTEPHVPRFLHPEEIAAREDSTPAEPLTPTETVPTDIPPYPLPPTADQAAFLEWNKDSTWQSRLRTALHLPSFTNNTIASCPRMRRSPSATISQNRLSQVLHYQSIPLKQLPMHLTHYAHSLATQILNITPPQSLQLKLLIPLRDRGGEKVEGELFVHKLCAAKKYYRIIDFDIHEAYDMAAQHAHQQTQTRSSAYFFFACRVTIDDQEPHHEPEITETG